MIIDSNTAMVVLSGGQDSTTCLGWALANYASVHCVSFYYGQKHAIELESARAVVAFFSEALGRDIPHEVVEIGDIFAGMSPLTNKDAPLETYKDHDEMEAIIGDRVEKTFVPMRNAAFLTLAANRAVVAGCGVLVTGVCEADNANYPDCRRIFIQSMEDTINTALGFDRDGYNYLRIATPLINASKAQSIKMAIDLPFTYPALAYSHTAYDGKYPPTGKDHASVLRAHGFEQAGMPDPLVVRAWIEELMDLPKTANYERLRNGDQPLDAAVVDLLDILETENLKEVTGV